MNKQKVVVLLIDSDKERADVLSSKLKAFGYTAYCYSDFEAMNNYLSKDTAQLVIVEQTLLDMPSVNTKERLKELKNKSICIYMLSACPNGSFKKYFANGIEGVFEKSIDAGTLIKAVRKSSVPQDLQWQVTLNQLPKESISCIANSLDELQEYQKLRFGRGGFSMLFDIELQVADRIGYSFYFLRHGQSYVIQGIAVVRWVDSGTTWAGVEFESMSGLGTSAFIEWLSEKDFLEYIPLAA